MLLNICDDKPHGVEKDIFNLATESLLSRVTHIFIASQQWDQINIKLDDTIKPDDVKYLHTLTENIHASIPNNPSNNVLQCLCALYPDEAGNLRYTYMQKGNLEKVVDKIEVYN